MKCKIKFKNYTKNILIVNLFKFLILENKIIVNWFSEITSHQVG